MKIGVRNRKLNVQAVFPVTIPAFKPIKYKNNRKRNVKLNWPRVIFTQTLKD